MRFVLEHALMGTQEPLPSVTVTDREACLALMSSIVKTHRQRERAHATLQSLLHCSGSGAAPYILP